MAFTVRNFIFGRFERERERERERGRERERINILYAQKIL